MESNYVRQHTNLCVQYMYEDPKFYCLSLSLSLEHLLQRKRLQTIKHRKTNV